MLRLISLLSTLIASSALAAPPDGLLLSKSTIAENLPAGSLVGTLSTLDPDPGDTHTYLLIDNPVDLFTLVGNELRTAEVLDYETGPQRQVRIRSTDGTGLWIERSFTIYVLDRNDPPLGVALSATGVPEDAALFSLVGTVSQLGDPDAGDAWTFRLIDDAGHFALEGNQLRVARPLDHETDALLWIEVEVTDRAGASARSVIPIQIWDRNEAPLGVAISASSVRETAPLGTVVGTLSAVGDPDRGDLHVFNIVGDSQGFTIVGATLRVAATLDFETTPTRTLRVRATDLGGLYAETLLTITIEDDNEAPTGVRLLGAGLAENQPIGTIAGLLEGLDPDRNDSHTFELAEAAPFLIDDATLFALASFDYETQPVVPVKVRVTDAGGLSTVATLTVPILDVNEAPTAISLSGAQVYETAPNGALVGFLTVTDPDQGDSHELHLLADGNGSFRIDGRILRKNGPLDFETAPSVSITVIAFDRAGLSLTRTFTIEVLDVDEPATGVAVDPSSIAENQPIGTIVGRLIPVGDPDTADGYRYELVENPGGRFAIVGDTLRTAALFDYEVTRSVQLRIRAIPPVGAPIEQAVTIDILDEPEPPTGISIGGNVIQENRAPGTFIATLAAVGDPDIADTHVFTLVENPDAAFSIQGNTLTNAKILDYETRDRYELTIRATDRYGLYVDVTFEVRVLDVNEPPTGVTIDNRTIPENAGPNRVVGTLSPVGDPDHVDRHTYTLSSNPDDRFDIIGNTLVARTSFDYETPPTSFRVVVRVSDQGNLTAETAIFIEVLDVNEPPSPLGLAQRTLAENAPAGTIVGVLSGGVDPDVGDIAIFKILEGQGFAVDAERRLVTTRPFDHETEPTVSVTVELSDSAGHTVLGTWLITITDVPEPPTGVGLSTTTVSEAAPVGTVIGTLSALGDPDLGDTHTFTLTDAFERFALAGDNLVLAAPVDYETNSEYEIFVTATDATGLTATSRIVITVLDDNDPPTTRPEWALPSIAEDEIGQGVTIDTLRDGLDAQDQDDDALVFRVVALHQEGETIADAIGGWETRQGDAWVPVTVGEPLLERLRFVPAPNANGIAALVVEAFDGTLPSEPATLFQEVRAVNDAPFHLLGRGRFDTSQHARTPVADALGELAVDDVDAEVLSVGLTAAHGTVYLPTARLTVRAGATRSSHVVVEGKIGDLDAALAELVYTPNANFVGDTTLVIRTDDLGATGEGGPQVTTDTIAITVAAGPDLIVTRNGVDLESGATVLEAPSGVGAYHHWRVGIENRGGAELVLDTPHGLELLAVDNADAWVTVRPRARLAPGESTTAVITVRPLTPGPVTLTWAIDSNDAEPRRWQTTVTSTATLAADLEVRDGVRLVQNGLPHPLADLVPGETRRVELTLANIGAARLELDDAEVITASANIDVALEAPFPLIDTGASDRLVLYLTPRAVGRLDLHIELPTNDPDNPLFELHLVADAVSTPNARLVLERVQGVPLVNGAIDDLGFARADKELGVPLRLVNLGARSLAAPKATVRNENQTTTRLALETPEALPPGGVLDFHLFLLAESAGPFSVDLAVGADVWTLRGEALAEGDPLPAEAFALYRHGAGRIGTSDALGPVEIGVPGHHAWLLVNQSPEPWILGAPFALANLTNVDAVPNRQPSDLPPQRAALVPVTTLAPRAGPLAFDIETALLPTVTVSSNGQVGQLGLALESGQRLSPHGVVVLPLQRVGAKLEVKVRAINDGNGPLTLGAPSLDGDLACVRVRGPAATVLAPGETTTLTLDLEPTAGAFGCTLNVPSDDALRPVFEVGFTARGTTAGSKNSGCQGGHEGLVALLAFALAWGIRRPRSA